MVWSPPALSSVLSWESEMTQRFPVVASPFFRILSCFILAANDVCVDNNTIAHALPHYNCSIVIKPTTLLINLGSILLSVSILPYLVSDDTSLLLLHDGQRKCRCLGVRFPIECGHNTTSTTTTTVTPESRGRHEWIGAIGQ
jgi:hypothetical protein